MEQVARQGAARGVQHRGETPGSDKALVGYRGTASVTQARAGTLAWTRSARETGGFHEPVARKEPLERKPVATPAAAPAPTPNLHASHNIALPKSLLRSALLVQAAESLPGAVGGPVSQSEIAAPEVPTTSGDDAHINTADMSLSWKDFALASGTPASAALAQGPGSMPTAQAAGNTSQESPGLARAITVMCASLESSLDDASVTASTAKGTPPASPKFQGTHSAKTRAVSSPVSAISSSDSSASNKSSRSSTAGVKSIGVYFKRSPSTSGLMAVKAVAPDAPVLTKDLARPGDEVLEIGGEEIRGKSMPEFALSLRAACAAAYEAEAAKLQEAEGVAGDAGARQILLRRAGSDVCHAVLVDASPSKSKFLSLAGCPTSHPPTSSASSSASRAEADTEAGLDRPRARGSVGAVRVVDGGGEGPELELFADDVKVADRDTPGRPHWSPAHANKVCGV